MRRRVAIVLAMAVLVTGVAVGADFSVYGGINIYPPSFLATALTGSSPVGFIAGASAGFDIARDLQIGPDAAYINLFSINSGVVGQFSVNMVPVTLSLMALSSSSVVAIGLGAGFPFVSGEVLDEDIPVSLSPTVLLSTAYLFRTGDRDGTRFEGGLRSYFFYDPEAGEIPMGMTVGLVVGLVL